MSPQNLARPGQDKAADQAVFVTTKASKKIARFRERPAFVDDLPFKAQHLIGCDYKIVGAAARDSHCLLLRELNGNGFGRRSGFLVFCFGYLFVDVRSLNLEVYAGCPQQRGAACARRGENDLQSCASLRSVRRLRTAAAVSSIDRRETSIEGHSCCPKIFRVAAISARTASTST